jgi:PKD repeat protein
MKKLFILFLFVLISCLSFSQVGNNMCEGALPFCTGTSYSFPAGTGTPNAQSGPFYSCLNTTPNPAWYYMKIALPGTIQITMHSEPAHDIDFCCWGPYDNQNACGQLTSNKVVDCSYSTAATEVVDIPGAQTGKYYILIITNFSNQPCNIIFSQTGGTGTTDCTILPPAATSDSPLCVGETLHLHAANMNNAIYHWLGPDGWASTAQHPVRNNVQLSMAGIYKLWVTVNGQPSADTNLTTVGIFEKPTASLSGGDTICHGDSTQLVITCQNHPPWTVQLTANGQLPVNIPIITSPYYFYVKPGVNTTYTLTGIANEICTGIARGNASVVVNPRPLANFTYDNTCSGYLTQFTDISMVSTGFAAGWNWSFGVNGDSSNIQNPSYVYSAGGEYAVFLKVTSNNGCTGQVTKQLLINPTPISDAGNDKSIPYGTNTTLQGLATGGTGSYSYHWEPASLLVNPDVQNPTTVNLALTTDFTLTVTDLGNACQKADVTTITITGGPLGVQLDAQPDAICLGSTTSINAQTGGGSGNYTFSWTSNPPGFTSTLEDVTVMPSVTTTYILEVNDGFTSQIKSIPITVYQNPNVVAGSPQTIPNGTNTLLSGTATSTATPITYSWTPVEFVTNPTNATTATILLSATTNFILTATDGHGCISSDEILVTITGGPLAVNPQAVHSPLCLGESTVLHPLSEGGAGFYTYSWTGPGGFTSSQSDPVVTPTQTSKYYLTVDDGFTQITDDVDVIVNPLPFINLIPPGAHILSSDTILACVFDTISLSAFNPKASYLWSNGSVNSEILSATTGMAFDMLSYSVIVTDSLTKCNNSAALTIMFTFGECSYGITDFGETGILVYPNPGNGILTCRINQTNIDMEVEVSDVRGAIVYKQMLKSEDSWNFKIDLANQPAGVYLLRILGDGRSHVIKVLKY